MLKLFAAILLLLLGLWEQVREWRRLGRMARNRREGKS